jgi:hypothetical protein
MQVGETLRGLMVDGLWLMDFIAHKLLSSINYQPSTINLSHSGQ